VPSTIVNQKRDLTAWFIHHVKRKELIMSKEKPVNVLIPSELYEKFKIKLVKEGKSMKKKIIELIENYVKS